MGIFVADRTGLEPATFPTVSVGTLQALTKKHPIMGIFMADRTGLEPATSAVTGRCSNQLNYRSVNFLCNCVFFLYNSISQEFVWIK